MSEKKISLTQQDELSVSAEIFACIISRLRWRMGPAAAAPPAPAETPCDMLLSPPGTSRLLVPSGWGEQGCTAPLEPPMGRDAPASWVTPQAGPVHPLPLTLARGGEHPAHLEAQGEFPWGGRVTPLCPASHHLAEGAQWLVSRLAKGRAWSTFTYCCSPSAAPTAPKSIEA